jgi:hypothetical protein
MPLVAVTNQWMALLQHNQMALDALIMVVMMSSHLQLLWLHSLRLLSLIIHLDLYLSLVAICIDRVNARDDRCLTKAADEDTIDYCATIATSSTIKHNV